MRLSGLSLRVTTAILITSAAFAQSYGLRTLLGRSAITDGILATEATFREVRRIAYGPKGDLFIADAKEGRVWRVNKEGRISSFAGGNYGCLGSTATADTVCLERPISLAVDEAENVYVGEEAGRIRRIDGKSGVITHIAGNGAAGFSGDGLPALQASFIPHDLVVDRQGNLYGLHPSNPRIFKIDARTGIFRHLAGNGSFGPIDELAPATNQPIGIPGSIALDARGNLYFCDSGARAIRRLTPEGAISNFLPFNLNLFGAVIRIDAAEKIVLGTSSTIYRQRNGAGFELVGGKPDSSNFQVVDNSVALDISLPGISDIAIGGPGGFAVVGANFVYRIDSAGKVRVDAGKARSRDRANFLLNLPTGAAIMRDGAVMVAHSSDPTSFFGDSLHWITPSTVENRIVGTFGTSFAGARGAHSIVLRDGLPIFSDEAGNAVYGLDATNQASLVAGIPRRPTGFCLLANPDIVAGSRATSECLPGPRGLALASNGDLYVADNRGAVVRRVTREGHLYAVAGNTNRQFSGDRGLATAAGMDPNDVAVDSAGNVFIADTRHHRIRRVDAASLIITTVVGTGEAGFSGDGGPALAAKLNLPTGLEFDSAGNLLIADWGNSRVRRVERDGAIRTIAGTGKRAFNAEPGSALATNISPYDLFKDASGNLFIIDRENDRIRALTVLTATRLVVAGGDNQRGAAGEPAAQPLRVRVVSAEGIGVAGIRVEFRVESGPAVLSQTAAISDGDGFASTQANYGMSEGTAVITATAPGLGSIRFTIATEIAPTIRAVTGAGLTPAATGRLSPGGLATIFGTEFAVPGTLRQLEAADLDARRLPLLLSQTCVELKATRAPVFLVSPTQINFQVPAGLPPGPVEIQVVRGCGGTQEKRSPVFTANLVPAAPEFFAFRSPEAGRFPVAAVESVTGALIGPTALLAGVVTRPARPGDYITVYGTGFGAVQGGALAGEVPVEPSALSGNVRVLLDGVELGPSEILYAGVTPGSAGLFQLNLRIPVDAAEGLRRLVIVVDGASSDDGAYLAIGR